MTAVDGDGFPGRLNGLLIASGQPVGNAEGRPIVRSTAQFAKLCSCLLRLFLFPRQVGQTEYQGAPRRNMTAVDGDGLPGRLNRLFIASGLPVSTAEECPILGCSAQLTKLCLCLPCLFLFPR